MTMLKPGDIVLLSFPLTSGGLGKPRPALVVFDSGDADVVVARITSVDRLTPYDVTLVDWAAEGLRLASTARLHKLATLEKSGIARQLGVLSAADRASVSSVLKSMFGNW